MKIELFSEAKYQATRERALIKKINIVGKQEFQYLERLGSDYDSELPSILNSIRQQGIDRVANAERLYWVKGTKLPYSNLSTAEQVFLLAYAADVTETSVYFYKDIMQLSERVLRIFIHRFGPSAYVNILCETTTFLGVYRNIMGRAISC